MGAMVEAKVAAQISEFLCKLHALSIREDIWLYKSGESVYIRWGSNPYAEVDLPREADQTPTYGIMIHS